ncbi:MAG TPA: YeeE/YedE family protein [Coprothermobacter proteolyticus]|nr:YeeE/YedE family protein [Coprothermobacter proteolyticus]
MQGTLIGGLIVGLLFGFLLQRSRMCFNSAIRDVRYFKDNWLWKQGLMAIAVETIGFQLMAALGVIKLNPSAFIPAAQIVGGFAFGMGMVLAGGCASGVTYRIGEGNAVAIIAATFYALFAGAARNGKLKPITALFGKPITVTMENPGVYAAKDGQVAPTVANLLGIDPWIVAIVFALIIFAYLFFTKTSQRKAPMHWTVGGILIGLVGMLGYWSQQTYSLGITGGWINLFTATLTDAPYNWIGMEVFGIIIGAFIAALIFKEFKIRFPKDPKAYVYAVIGGALMGWGAGVAGGCNIGHFLSGVPHLAISSLLATAFFILGNWFMYWLLYGRD